MSIEEFFDNLKILAKHSGANLASIELETEDGYIISISARAKREKPKSSNV